jgi:hypothetical protein
VAELPDRRMTDGVRSLEIRWILPGSLDGVVAGWFGRFPSSEESREDFYLVEPQLHGLSVKLRGGATLEVKMYRGSPGTLTVPGRATGHMESWQKSSFPFSPLSADSGDPLGWQQVRKKRHVTRFSRESIRAAGAVRRRRQQPKCEVELAEVQTSGQVWWTLGFEATGPADLLPSELQATAELVFAHPPSGLELGQRDSKSYAQWLSQRRGAGVRSAH